VGEEKHIVKHRRIYMNKIYEQEFETFNEQLSQKTTDLNLPIDIKQIFKQDDDKNDRRLDLEQICSKLDEIVRLLLEQQEKHYCEIKNDLSERFRSMQEQFRHGLGKIENNHRTEIEKAEPKYLRIYSHDLVRRRKIGSGSFSDVYSGYWRSREMEVAIKCIRLDNNQIGDENIRRDFINEVRQMSYIPPNRNVLGFWGASITSTDYELVVELMPLGSLYELLHKRKVEITWIDRWDMASQIVEGVHHLHKLEPPIIHCDIKSMNLLLKLEHSKSYVVKVADFGLAKVKQETCRTASKGEVAGTLQYKAPELLKFGGNTMKSDVYAIAIVMWELVSGKIPYADSDQPTIRLGVLDGDRLHIPSETIPSFRDIISHSWSQQPYDRPTCEKLIQMIKDARNIKISSEDLFLQVLQRKTSNVQTLKRQQNSLVNTTQELSSTTTKGTSYMPSWLQTPKCSQRFWPNSLDNNTKQVSKTEKKDPNSLVALFNDDNHESKK
ncbi:unnamed protein product, partial [Didymodactylos carnosus]